MLLSVVQATPQVVPQTVQVVTQYVTPSWFNEMVALSSFLVPGYVASAAHSLVKSHFAKLQADAYDWLNAALLFAYSLLVSVGVLYFDGHLTSALSSPEQLATAFSLVFGAASARYAVLKLKAPKVAPVVEAPQV